MVVTASTLTYLQIIQDSAILPNVHPTSRYVTACDELYQAFHTLVLQVADAGVKCLGTRLVPGKVPNLT